MPEDLDAVIAAVLALPAPPIAFEAMWGGDTQGWSLTLLAVVAADGGYAATYLHTFENAGDIRLFNGQVPPWPEAGQARRWGPELAERFAVPFYFPSPNHPEDECPDWWEQDLGYPCRRCGIPLLQRDPCPWRGACYTCYLDEERERREAAWTPEERAGPRCSFCGAPAKAMLGENRVCLPCQEKYILFQCPRCGAKETRSRDYNAKHPLCSFCAASDRLAQSTAAQRQSIRHTFATRGKVAALNEIDDLLGCEMPESFDILHFLMQSSDSAPADPPHDGEP